MIRVEKLSKLYGTRLALDGISFSVDKGEVVGFLGPNGAGKTTTMRILTGFLTPSFGDVYVAGYDMSRQSLKARRRIGYFPETMPLYTNMTVRSYLEFSARLRGLDKSRIKTRIEDVVNMCHLEEYVDVLIGKLSRGFRQRVGVAQAIVHEPDVLILDEPTIGIDPIQVAMTRKLIKELGKECTILLSTHILSEVNMTCERVIIINEGKIVAEDRIEKLSSAMSGSRRIRMEIDGPAGKVIERLRKISGVIEVSREGSCFIVECSAGQELRGRITQIIVQEGWNLLSMESVDMSLENIFLKLIDEEETSR